MCLFRKCVSTRVIPIVRWNPVRVCFIYKRFSPCTIKYRKKTQTKAVSRLLGYVTATDRPAWRARRRPRWSSVFRRRRRRRDPSPVDSGTRESDAHYFYFYYFLVRKFAGFRDGGASISYNHCWMHTYHSSVRKHNYSKAVTHLGEAKGASLPKTIHKLRSYNWLNMVLVIWNFSRTVASLYVTNLNTLL